MAVLGLEHFLLGPPRPASFLAADFFPFLFKSASPAFPLPLDFVEKQSARQEAIHRL